MSTVHRLLRLELAVQAHVCLRCRVRHLQSALQAKRFSTSNVKSEGARRTVKIQKQWRREYFSANAGLNYTPENPVTTASTYGDAGELSSSQNPSDLTPPALPGSPSETVQSFSSPPPHRRRKRLKALQTPTANAPTSDSSTFLPPNSSSILTTLSTRLPTSSLRRTLTTCLSLSKPRLSFLIVLTTATAYSLYPVPSLLLPETTSSRSLSAITLLFLTAGTGLCAASANALNMLMEPEYDAQMSRTRNRPLVRGLIGKKGALIFAGVAGLMGVGGLWFGTSPTVASLGAANIVLYAGVYTPMKRVSVLNTWVGALVGGIPPLMGWAAAAGQSATGGGWREVLLSEESTGGWLLAGLLFAWQFPHFNSLSWPIREEYKQAGYRMLVWTNARMNGRVALRYAGLCFPICVGLWWYGITDQGFLVTSSVVNGWMVKEAWRFWRLEGHKGSAKGLFWASVWHLPVVMVLAMVHKKGLWEGIWKRIAGSEHEGMVIEERQAMVVSRRPKMIEGHV